MTGLVTVAAFTGPLEAHLARGRLETEGIPAFVAHEHHVWAGWMYSHALGGVKLQVAADRAEEARAVLREHEAGAYESALREGHPDVEENRCPRCGSTQFTSRFRRESLLLDVLTLGLALVIFPLRRENHTCSRCGQQWKY